MLKGGLQILVLMITLAVSAFDQREPNPISKGCPAWEYRLEVLVWDSKTSLKICPAWGTIQLLQLPFQSYTYSELEPTAGMTELAMCIYSINSDPILSQALVSCVCWLVCEQRSWLPWNGKFGTRNQHPRKQCNLAFLFPLWFDSLLASHWGFISAVWQG